MNIPSAGSLSLSYKADSQTTTTGVGCCDAVQCNDAAARSIYLLCHQKGWLDLPLFTNNNLISIVAF